MQLTLGVFYRGLILCLIYIHGELEVVGIQLNHVDPLLHAKPASVGQATTP